MVLWSEFDPYLDPSISIFGVFFLSSTPLSGAQVRPLSLPSLCWRWLIGWVHRYRHKRAVLADGPHLVSIVAVVVALVALITYRRTSFFVCRALLGFIQGGYVGRLCAQRPQPLC